MTGSKSFRPLAAHGECAWSSAPVVFVLCTPGPVDGPFTSPAVAGPAPIATSASAPTAAATDFLSLTESLLDRRSPVRARRYAGQPRSDTPGALWSGPGKRLARPPTTSADSQGR